MDTEVIAHLLDELDERERSALYEKLVARRKERARTWLARMDYYGARRLVCAALLAAVRDARRGSEKAWLWMQSERARELAALVDLERWPPSRTQIECAVESATA